LFPDSKGKIVLQSRTSPNIFLSEQLPDKQVVFKDDAGKLEIPFTVIEGSGDQPNEYVPLGKDLPEVTGLVNGTLTDPKTNKPTRAALLSLPKAKTGDVTEYEVYPEETFTVKPIRVTSRKKTLKNVEGYMITPKDAKEGSAVDVVFTTFKATLPEAKHSVTVLVVDDDSTLTGMLFTNYVSGPHSFFPSAGCMQWGPKDHKFEISGGVPQNTNLKEEAPLPGTTPETKPAAKEPAQPPPPSTYYISLY